MTSHFSPSTARAGLGFLALTLLAGCAGAPRWGSWSKHPAPEQLATASNPPAAKVQYKDGVYGTP